MFKDAYKSVFKPLNTKGSKRHVIFDLDDTLYPERDYAHSGFRAAARFAKEQWGIEGLADEMVRRLDAGHLGTVFKTSLRTLKPDHNDDHVAEIIRVYREHDPEITLFEDAVWALDYFGADYNLGLITDGDATAQSKKIDALEIRDRFVEIIVTGALGMSREFHKPHPKAYELIEQRIGRPGDHYVYIGDNPTKDFIVPNARRWTSIQVIRERTIHDPHAVVEGGEPQYRIESLRELEDLMPL